MQLIEAKLHDAMAAAYTLQRVDLEDQCPRATSSALLLNVELDIIAAGRNTLPVGEGPCSCNCGADTLVESSPTCKAVHAEAAALEYIKGKRLSSPETYMVTTRPPCKDCLALIKASTVHTIITTNQFPDRDKSEDDWLGVWIVLDFLEFHLTKAG